MSTQVVLALLLMTVAFFMGHGLGWYAHARQVLRERQEAAVADFERGHEGL